MNLGRDDERRIPVLAREAIHCRVAYRLYRAMVLDKDVGTEAWFKDLSKDRCCLIEDRDERQGDHNAP